MRTLSLRCEGGGETLALAGKLSPSVEHGLVLHLEGDLGSGKTTFAQGLLAGCGVDDEVVSPTYTLVETYEAGGKSFCHVDLYRCGSPREWLDAGLADVVDEADVALIEWPEKGEGLPRCDAVVRFGFASEGDARDVVLEARTGKGRRWLSALP